MSLPEKKLSRPSLYTQSVTDEDSAPKSASILDELDPGSPGKKLGRWLLMAALVGALGFGWATWQGKLSRQAPAVAPLADNGAGVQIKEESPTEAMPADAAPGEAAPSATIAAAGEANTEGLLGATNAVAPANIINEPVAAGPAQEAVRPAVIANPPIVLASVASQQTAAPASQESPAVVSKAEAVAPAVAENTKAIPAQEQVPEVQREPGRQPEVAKTLLPPEPAANTRQAKAPGKAAAASRPSKDGDVELIAALLNRVAAKPEPAKPANAAKEDSNEKQGRASGRKRDKKSAASRDTTANADNEMTAAQLKRCSSMSFFEAELCRFRTCNGRWGTDPSCPETAQASGYHP